VNSILSLTLVSKILRNVKSEKCDISVIFEIYNNLNTLDYATLENFIFIFDYICNLNI